MKYAHALLQRLGFTAKDDVTDAFDARLARIEKREAKCNGGTDPFRNQSKPQAA